MQLRFKKLVFFKDNLMDDFKYTVQARGFVRKGKKCVENLNTDLFLKKKLFN